MMGDGRERQRSDLRRRTVHSGNTRLELKGSFKGYEKDPSETRSVKERVSSDLNGTTKSTDVHGV